MVSIKKMKVMRVLFLIILFSICGVKTIVSQIKGVFHYEDTINFVFHQFYNAPRFDNYPNNSIVFTGAIHFSEKTYQVSDISLLDRNKLKNDCLQEELPDSLFNILFALDMFNIWPWLPEHPSWRAYDLNDTIVSNRRMTVFIPDDFVPDLIDKSESCYRYKDREDYLKKIRPDFKMYSPGNVSINENFLSKLIYVFKKDEYLSMQALYLVNIKNNQLQSVTNILQEFCDDCDNLNYMQVDFRLDNQIFSLKYSIGDKEGY